MTADETRACAITPDEAARRLALWISTCELGPRRPPQGVTMSERYIDVSRAGLAKMSDEQAARIAELTEACQAVLLNLDHLRSVWGDEGVTRTVCDKLRKAIETPEPRP
jgi:hypothetical protein